MADFQEGRHAFRKMISQNCEGWTGEERNQVSIYWYKLGMVRSCTREAAVGIQRKKLKYDCRGKNCRA